jgi:psiF repeat
MEELMKAILVVISLLLSTSALAADATCDATAKDKKLHGAALTSFMKKCENDATAKCEADAKAKNLHGAAQTSFTTKCVKDAKGS